MTIHHTALYASDLEAAKTYYQKYFGAAPSERYRNPKTGLRTYFMTFEGGGKLEIMHKPNLPATGTDCEHQGYIHLAVGVADKETVDALTARIEADGYKIYSRPRVTGDGYYESCVSDPDGNRIEIVADK
ncbi:MAG: VOC family protein [Oscillospiraceae bacterium]|nr:VOC family protein [Oscillospiraceae bacterium]